MSAAPAKFHGLLKDHLRKHLLIALAVSSATAAAWQVGFLVLSSCHINRVLLLCAIYQFSVVAQLVKYKRF